MLDIAHILLIYSTNCKLDIYILDIAYVYYGQIGTWLGQALASNRQRQVGTWLGRIELDTLTERLARQGQGGKQWGIGQRGVRRAIHRRWSHIIRITNGCCLVYLIYSMIYWQYIILFSLYLIVRTCSWLYVSIYYTYTY